MAAPELRAQLDKVGARPVGNSPAEFTAQIRSEVEPYAFREMERDMAGRAWEA